MIREIKNEDKKDWEKLYRGYADFYKVEMNDKILSTVWDWLRDKDHVVSGLVFEENSKIIAIAHYRKMPSPLSCLLYTSPSPRDATLSRMPSSA